MVSATQVPNIKAALSGQWDSRGILCPGSINHTICHYPASSCITNTWYDLAPYTWELVQGLKSGCALFIQPPMPIKCAGAPQKALYLSGDAWHRSGAVKNIDIQLMNAGGVLFGIKEYVPALMEYVQK